MSNKPPAMRRRQFLGLSLLAVALTISTGVVLWLAVELTSVSRVSAKIDQIRPFATSVRLVLVSLVAVMWPRLVQLAQQHGRIDEARRDHLLAQRWRVVGWLLVIELVLGQDLLGRFFAATTGPMV